METAGILNFPKLENPFELEPWMFSDHDHYLQRSILQAPTFTPTLQFQETYNWMYNAPTHPFLQYSAPAHPLPYHHNTDDFTQNSANNLFTSDFNYMWNECPQLCDDDVFKPIEELHSLMFDDPLKPLVFSNQNEQLPLVPYTTTTTTTIISITTTNNVIDFKDQSLSMVVAEGVNRAGSGEPRRTKDEVMTNETIRVSNKVHKAEMLGYEEIIKCFEMPISQAAKELNVGLTILKKRCRELNIKRWPHRKIKSLEGLISNVKEMGGGKETIEALEKYRRRLLTVPGMELTEETKRLRQACFKANYKKRKALASSN